MHNPHLPRAQQFAERAFANTERFCILRVPDDCRRFPPEEHKLIEAALMALQVR